MSMFCMHENEVTWDEYDARGIYLCKVCDKCSEAKLAEFSFGAINDPCYETDEPIDEP